MLREACPDLSSQEFYWRMVSTFGAMIYLLAEPGWVHQLVGSGFDVSDKDAAVTCAMPFLAAGMTAPRDLKRVANPRPGSSRQTRKKPAKKTVKRTGKTASPA
jgi:hypothetical protein